MSRSAAYDGASGDSPRLLAPSADLAITKIASPDPVQLGSNLTYTLTISNNGPKSASSVTVTDTLPNSTMFVSCAATGGGICGGSGLNRTVTFSSLGVGKSVTVTLVASVASGADGSTIRNTGRVRSSKTSDPSLSNNAATASVTVSNPRADVALAKSGAPDPVAAGSELTYTLTVTNNGPRAASSVVVTDTLPASTSFTSCSSTGGGACGGSGNNRTVSFSSLAAGASATITLVATVNGSAADGAAIANTARVSAADPPDPTPANNAATATVTVSNVQADVALAKSGAPDPVEAGWKVTYTLTVSNDGPARAASVTVTDTLPSSTTFFSCSSTGGGACKGSGNVRTVSFTSLSAGSAETVTLVAWVDDELAEGTVITNRAFVGSAETSDPDPADNSATATLTTTAAAPNTYHVSTTGSDRNPGTLLLPFRTVQMAVDAASPGDTLQVHPGTYDGQVVITRSGKLGLPIMLLPALAGTVTLQASFPIEPCSKTGPTFKRTINIKDGADYWTIRGLEVVNGIMVRGTDADSLRLYVQDRSLPGRGMYDPEGARYTIESLGGDAADHVEILDNKIRRRGILTQAARDLLIADNEISDIDCGTGGGMWVAIFSDRAAILRNYVHDIADSNGLHYMSEGIRVVTGSMYGNFEQNVVERIAGAGRGITTDVNAGWNVIRDNRVSQTDIGFSEQQAGWGNHWLDNVAEGNRRYGFRVGPGLGTPDETTPRFIQMGCNQSVNDPIALSIGSATESRWENNDFATVELKEFASYWPYSGNTWDGSSEPPPKNPSNPGFASCSSSP